MKIKNSLAASTINNVAHYENREKRKVRKIDWLQVGILIGATLTVLYIIGFIITYSRAVDRAVGL